MFGKLLFVCALAAAVAYEYPAGVHPAICPNYPFCDSETLARFTPEGMPIPEWYRNPSLIPTPVPIPAAAAPEAPAAPKYPADFPAALCPNYPFCN